MASNATSAAAVKSGLAGLRQLQDELRLLTQHRHESNRLGGSQSGAGTGTSNGGPESTVVNEVRPTVAMRMDYATESIPYLHKYICAWAGADELSVHLTSVDFVEDRDSGLAAVVAGDNFGRIRVFVRQELSGEPASSQNFNSGSPISVDALELVSARWRLCFSTTASAPVTCVRWVWDRASPISTMCLLAITGTGPSTMMTFAMAEIAPPAAQPSASSSDKVSPENSSEVSLQEVAMPAASPDRRAAHAKPRGLASVLPSDFDLWILRMPGYTGSDDVTNAAWRFFVHADREPLEPLAASKPPPAPLSLGDRALLQTADASRTVDALPVAQISIVGGIGGFLVRSSRGDLVAVDAKSSSVRSLLSNDQLRSAVGAQRLISAITLDPSQSVVAIATTGSRHIGRTSWMASNAGDQRSADVSRGDVQQVYLRDPARVFVLSVGTGQTLAILPAAHTGPSITTMAFSEPAVSDNQGRSRYGISTAAAPVLLSAGPELGAPSASHAATQLTVGGYSMAVYHSPSLSWKGNDVSCVYCARYFAPEGGGHFLRPLMSALPPSASSTKASIHNPLTLLGAVIVGTCRAAKPAEIDRVELHLWYSGRDRSAFALRLELPSDAVASLTAGAALTGTVHLQFLPLATREGIVTLLLCVPDSTGAFSVLHSIAVPLQLSETEAARASARSCISPLSAHRVTFSSTEGRNIGRVRGIVRVGTSDLYCITTQSGYVVIAAAVVSDSADEAASGAVLRPLRVLQVDDFLQSSRPAPLLKSPHPPRLYGTGSAVACLRVLDEARFVPHLQRYLQGPREEQEQQCALAGCELIVPAALASQSALSSAFPGRETTRDIAYSMLLR